MRFQYRRDCLPIVLNQELEICAMTNSWKRRFLCLTAAVGLAFCVTASAKDMVNMLPNPGFETGMPEPWREFNFGHYRLVRDPEKAHSGQYCAEFAWRKPGKGYYSTLECIHYMDVYPGATYEQGVWARGRGQFRFWAVMSTKSAQFQGTSMSKYQSLTDEWKHYSRKWTCPEGIYRVVFFMEVSENTVVNFDDANFSYDRDVFTPPEAETLKVMPQVRATDAKVKIYLNNKSFEGPQKIVYGEQVIGIEAHATGDNPLLSGSVRFGNHEVKLDKRWRAAPMPADESWRKAGFDDRAWKPVTEQNGIWDTDGLKSVALRRVVLWKTQRAEPFRKNQWIVLMRDRMYVAEDSAGAFVFVVNESPSKTPAKKLTMHIEAPAFMSLLDREEGAVFWHTNWHHDKLETTEFERDGVKYVRYALTYRIAKAPRYVTYAPLYFKAHKDIPRSDNYTFTFWREANRNITDVPMVLPITVTGIVNGRQCKFFHLTYDGSPACHQANAFPYSKVERYELTKTLIDTGMNVMRFRVADKDWGKEYLRFVKKHNVHTWNQFNTGMVWPRPAEDAPYEGLHSITHQTLDKHPELQAVLYDGGKEAFENSLGFVYEDRRGNRMWCQEYVAKGGKVFLDSFRPLIESDKKKLGGTMLYVMWDWEYSTFQNSCFCVRCKSAFAKSFKVPDALQLSAEAIITQHPKKWIKFRLEQEGRHQLSFAKFLKEYDVLLTNWHPGQAITSGYFDYTLLGDTYEYHKSGWPGSDLPLLGIGRRGEIAEPWKKINPNIQFLGMTHTMTFWSQVIDERMFKIWTLNVALGTHGGGWVLWQEVAFNQTHGQSYFMGEATRLINDFEEYFKKSRHIETKFHQQGLTGKANELIALEGPDGKDALVLLFNQSDKPAEVTVTVKDRAAAWNTAQHWEGKKFNDATKLTIIVPAKDVVALHYR